MSFAKKVLVLLAGLVVLVLAVGFVLPDRFTLARSIEIAAPPAQVFAQVADFHAWRAWDPWTQNDDSLSYTYEAPPGVGHTQRWTSRRSGQGAFTVTESVPGERLVIEMDFGSLPRPSSTFVFAATAAGGTRVTWRMDGENGLRPLGNYMGLLMDGFVGPMYETGLNNLKARVEQGDAPTAGGG